MKAKCARCGCYRDDHPVILPAGEPGLTTRIRTEDLIMCGRYEPPAPWWLP